MNGMHDFRLIGQREKIAFRCSQCGGCCRNVRDSVMLKPYDAYRLIRHIRQKSAGYTAEDILEQRCVLKPLSRGFEVYVLKTTDDSGVCTFLEDNRCSVYEGRPQTCRLYPFCAGPGATSTQLAWGLCTERGEHFGQGSVTVREWKRKSLDRDEEAVILAEFDAVAALGRLMKLIPDENLVRATMLTLLYSYHFYELERPFLQQYLRNVELLKQQLFALGASAT